MLTPIVVVSALDDHESLEQAVLAGASAFLTKPVREDDLERALELIALQHPQDPENVERTQQIMEHARRILSLRAFFDALACRCYNRQSSLTPGIPQWSQTKSLSNGASISLARYAF